MLALPLVNGRQFGYHAPPRLLGEVGALWADVGENDGHEEDGVDGPGCDDHAHDLEEGPEEVGLGKEQHGHADEGGHAAVEDGPRGVHEGVAGPVLPQGSVRH